MTPLAFLRTPQVTALLERASRCAGAPIGVHHVERNQEGPPIIHVGACAACQYVAEQSGGKQACRYARMPASGMALRQQRAIPFLCHMGFACIAVPLFPEASFVATVGPYCPASDAASLPVDALHGLEMLTGNSVSTLPVSLEDIHLAPPDALPEIVAWMQQDFIQLWHAENQSQQPKSDASATMSEAEEKVATTRATSPRRTDAGTAEAIALTLVGGDQPQARKYFAGALAEYEENRVPIARQRARVIAIVGGVLEAAERAGMACEALWQSLPQWTDSLLSCQTTDELLRASMRILGILRRRAAPQEVQAGYSALNTLIQSRLDQSIQLESVAAQLGETPSALSHRLQRKFGMSFSEYVGRMRVEKAKELLRQGRYTASEVAQQVGIRDQSNFSKLFKRHEGISPSLYQKQYGGKT